ncbi:MAG: sugar phosphate isomerase/epimerase [Planctomycetes bacterium]|nr:sugar phosphate isomerase/epimerase [Planctomycetota bacterium]
MSTFTPNRREFTTTLASFCAGGMASAHVALAAQTPKGFSLRYILASAMYGYTDLAEILPEVKKVGAEAIDIWPKVHGNQREQLETLGLEQAAELLQQHQVKLGSIACYKLGPFQLQEEMQFARKLGGRGVVLVCTARGPVNLQGGELKTAIGKFVETMKPHVAAAEETGCVIAIENHSSSLITSPDSIRWLAELSKSAHLGLAFAPHHLPQDSELQASIIRDVVPSIKLFYAQQHGMGSQQKRPKEQELLQMPGRGPFDFTPLLAAFRTARYAGWTEIFMHPVPRGVPILDSTEKITAEINRSRKYLNNCLKGN